MTIKHKAIIGAILIGCLLGIAGCSRNFKAPDSLYGFESDEEGFIYGKLVIEDRSVTRIKISYVNAMNGKRRSYERDFTDHLYGRREDDYTLRVPAGTWDCVAVDLMEGETIRRTESKPWRFRVESTRGSYLGTWVFASVGGMRIDDDKAVQDGKIAEAYPRLNLNATARALPVSAGVTFIK